MQTISTKYLPATNFRGARIKATHSGGLKSATVSAECAGHCGSNEAHVIAAKALCKKLDWSGRLIGGHTASGMVFVFDSPGFSPAFEVGK